MAEVDHAKRVQECQEEIDALEATINSPHVDEIVKERLKLALNTLKSSLRLYEKVNCHDKKDQTSGKKD